MYIVIFCDDDQDLEIDEYGLCIFIYRELGIIICFQNLVWVDVWIGGFFNCIILFRVELWQSGI